MNISDEKVWKRLLEQDSKLNDLAIKAGVENNSKRAQELNGCFAVNCGDGVIQSEAERELALYLFCTDFEGECINNAIQGRISAAKAAGIGINDL